MAQAHILGAIIGAAATGAAIGAVGRLLPTGGGGDPEQKQRLVILSILVGLSAAFALDELSILRLPHPQSVKQVPTSWQRFHPIVTALLYGVGLGTGISTRVITGVPYVIFSSLLLLAQPVYGALAFGVFGLSRGGLAVAISWRMRHRGGANELQSAAQKLLRWDPQIHLLAGFLLACCAGYWGVSLVVLVAR